MSQNHDQGRPNPSQNWYDNGQEPQSKRFPFGAQPTPAEQAQYDEDPRYGQTPPFGQQPVENAPQAPQYGQPPQQQGQPQQYSGTQGAPQYGGAQPYGAPQNQSAPQYGQPDPGQWQQPQTGGQPQNQPGGPNGQGQPQPNGYGHPPQGQPPQGQPPQGQPPQEQNPQGQQGQGRQYDSGSQSFQGILDPHTGEIHPVPDLEGLQDADALLVVVSGPDSGSQILLDTDVVTVGRSPNADIFLDDVTVSRKHAEFIRTPSGFTLRDTGSLNGTYVGRQLIDSIELQNGADVQIGKFRMIFQQRPRS